MKQGDFTNLADDYAKYRPSYNTKLVKKIIAAVGMRPEAIKAVDIGAGTGIFTKCLLGEGLSEVTAIEPNLKMREAGRKYLGEDARFLNGSAEKTGLESSSVDLISMASSFHWAKTYDALSEFDRILVKNGVFSALWNPRLTNRSPIESEVEKLLSGEYKIKSRVSSGLSGITAELYNILSGCGFFRSVIYVDAVDVMRRTPKEYIGAWRSVNDIQAQLGEYKFSKFIGEIEKIIYKKPYVDVHYLTRVWIAKK